MRKIGLYLKKRLLGKFSAFEYAYLFSWCLFLTAIWKNMFVYDGYSYWAGWGHLWADWSAHISYVLNMTYRSLTLPYHPMYWGVPFRYHFAADLISALLLRSGIPLVPSFLIPSIVFTYALIFSVYIFFRTVFNSRFVAMVSTPLFLFNGGLGFAWYMYYSYMHNPIINTFSGHVPTFSQIDAIHIEFANIFTNYFIPQRAFLLGFPISVFIILYLWRIVRNNQSAPYALKQSIPLGILTGFFPLIHIYSYIVIVCMAGYFAIWNFISGKKNTRFWLPYFSLSLGIGILIFLEFWGKNGANHFTVYPFWTAKGYFPGWIWYWIMNEGFLFIFSFIGFFYISTELKILTLPFAFIFFISNIIIFQPHGWDNGKFFTYSYLWSAGLVGNFLVTAHRKIPKSAIRLCILTLIFLTSIASGATDVINLLQFDRQKIHFFTDSDLKLGAEVRQIIPPDDTLLTGPITSYVSIFSGRQVLMGLDFWITSYGIDTKNRNKEIHTIYSGKAGALQLLAKYPIKYVLISPREREILEVNDGFFSSRYPVVLKTAETVIYKVSE